MKDNKIKKFALKFCLLGDAMVGKTSIINLCKGIKFTQDTPHTIYDKIEKTFILQNGEKIKIFFWDVTGQERYRSPVITRIRFSQGILLIFDFTQRKSFDNLDIWLRTIKEELHKPFIVLFGNKIDKDKNEWKVTSEEAINFAEEKGIAYFETSAKTGQGIDEGLSYLVNNTYEQVKGRESKKIKIIIDNNDKIKSNKNSDCLGNKKGKNNKK